MRKKGGKLEALEEKRKYNRDQEKKRQTNPEKKGRRRVKQK